MLVIDALPACLPPQRDVHTGRIASSIYLLPRMLDALVALQPFLPRCVFPCVATSLLLRISPCLPSSSASSAATSSPRCRVSHLQTRCRMLRV